MHSRPSWPRAGHPPPFSWTVTAPASGRPFGRWHLNLVLPLARLVEHELTVKLETPVELKFDSYALDMVSRATVVAKLAQAGVPMATALQAVNLDGG